MGEQKSTIKRIARKTESREDKEWKTIVTKKMQAYN